MSDLNATLPLGFAKGPMQGANIIGEITESVQRFIMDGWTSDRQPPRIEEDLSFIPKDREEVIYLYMYRAERNQALVNDKRFRPAKFPVKEGDSGELKIYYERAPLYLNLYYLICVHSKFRSDAERLMGYAMLRMSEASNLIYRPRKYVLPEGGEVDSMGRPWSIDAEGDDVIMEKVSVAMTEDMTVGDAINFFTIHEAPYRPYLTYRAICAMEGALVSGGPTTVRSMPVEGMTQPAPENSRPSGRLGLRSPGAPKSRATSFGPPGHNLRPIEDSNDNEE